MDVRGMKIQVKVLDHELYADVEGVLQYASAGAAAVDLRSTASVYLRPQECVPIGTGLSIYGGSLAETLGPCPDPQQFAVAAVILPRSGLGAKKGIVLGNLVGLIDEDYQGEIIVPLWNRTEKNSQGVTIRRGERIAQMMFMIVLRPTFVTVTEFSAMTARGAGGFGSTGRL